MINPEDENFENSSNELNQINNDPSSTYSGINNTDSVEQDAKASNNSNIAQQVGDKTDIRVSLISISNNRITINLDANGLVVLVGLSACFAELWLLTRLVTKTDKYSTWNYSDDLFGVSEHALERKGLLISGRVRENFLFEPTLHLNGSALDNHLAQLDSDGASLIATMNGVVVDTSESPMVLHSPIGPLVFSENICILSCQTSELSLLASSSVTRVNDPKGQASTQKRNKRLFNPHRKTSHTPSKKKEAQSVVGIPIMQPEISDRTSIPEKPVGFMPLLMLALGLACLKHIKNRKH